MSARKNDRLGAGRLGARAGHSPVGIRRTCQKLHFQNRSESLAQSHGLTHGTVIEWDDAATFAQVEEISPESPIPVELEGGKAIYWCACGARMRRFATALINHCNYLGSSGPSPCAGRTYRCAGRTERRSVRWEL
jgi:hypothetical protein